MTQTSKALTSAEIISSNTVKTSTIIPLSNATVTVTTPSTTPQCRDEDCQCNGGECIFNTTLGRCHCHCQESVYGDSCVFGQNNTYANIDSGAIPTRRVNVTMKIDITFVDAYTNLNSPESLTFINKLRKELEALCKEADPLAFKKVQIINLTQGSVVAESVAEYNYLNNETQIHYVNTKLDGVLTNILNDTNNLNKISRAFENASVQLNGLTLQSPEIKNITDLKPFVNCSRFVDYTAVISNGQWQCVGPCKTNPDYCHHHGDCLNNIYIGSICRCYESSLEQFYGPQCELFRRGPGFYGALFGSLAAALLLLIIIVIAVVVKKKYTGIWRRNNSYNRRLSAFEEDFFDFSDTGEHNLGFAGTYTSRGFWPHLENVDTRLQVTTKRPDVWNINPR
ncbi:mucin-3B-like [Thunnus albacares]|uniref:mucin-3B-like n=1 Tax=Thunnus albacares TaxID=8236 RepID=UPI001CF6501E|nr:mucin-3B-like [Thunnus albacares]